VAAWVAALAAGGGACATAWTASATVRPEARPIHLCLPFVFVGADMIGLTLLDCLPPLRRSCWSNN
jgi:hypothetical protein